MKFHLRIIDFHEMFFSKSDILIFLNKFHKEFHKYIMKFSHIMNENSQSRHKLSSIPTPLKAIVEFSEASKASVSCKKKNVRR